MERQSYQIDYLLSMSRIPVRFYALIHKLSGKDAVYQNPGISVTSFVLARALRKEVVELEDQLVENFKMCVLFSTDRNILNQINESLIQASSGLVDQMSSLSQDQRLRLLPDVQELHTLGQMIKMAYDSLLSIQVKDEIVEINNIPGVTYKQNIFDMQDKIEEVSQKLEALLNPPPMQVA